jgi:AraC-like DNA-binding protein
VTVIIRRPGPPLSGLVRAITYQAGEQPQTTVEKLLPSPGAGLWVNLAADRFRSYGEDGRRAEVPGAMLAGPTSRPTVIEFEQGLAHISVSFALGAASCFFAVPLAEARDQLVPLAGLWGRAGASLRERVLEAVTPEAALAVMEQVLLERLCGVPDPAVAAAAAALSAGERVGDVADGLGLLPRTLRRRMVTEVGLTPKRLARVQRLKRVVRVLSEQDEADWAAVAAAHGYADQSHLSAEFRLLAGVTPAQYLRSRINGPNHLEAHLAAGPG